MCRKTFRKKMSILEKKIIVICDITLAHYTFISYQFDTLQCFCQQFKYMTETLYGLICRPEITWDAEHLFPDIGNK